MKRTILTVLAASSFANAETYEVKPGPGTKIELRVDKTGLYRGKTHVFLFEKYHGTLHFDPQKPEESRIELIIDSHSAVCTDDWVSANDLKKVMETTFNDMLAVKQFPAISFTSGAIKSLGVNRFEAQGMLTIRDMPKPVTVTVHLDAANPAVVRLRGSAKIHLKDYGLKPPSALLGAIGTKEEMSLTFEIIASL